MRLFEIKTAVSNLSATDLARAIREFVDKHAKINADFDPEFDDPEERFNGPDPVCLLNAANSLENFQKPRRVFSEWGSGCYQPIRDLEAKALHDSLVKAATDFNF